MVIEENRKPAVHQPSVFGVRHLSPAGAWYVREFLDRIQPRLVLIEGPSDFNDLIGELASERVLPPVAVMAYTKELPIQTILYPFAVYSPEYQAIRWAVEHGCECRFCDLPSEVFLGLEDQKRRRQAEQYADPSNLSKPQKGCSAEAVNSYLYRRLDELSGDGDHETFWERTMEQAADEEGYRSGAAEFGRSLRQLTQEICREIFGEQTENPENVKKTENARNPEDSEKTENRENTENSLRSAENPEDAENRLREAYMCRVIREAEENGIEPEKIAVVTGAYHVQGILECLAQDGTPVTGAACGQDESSRPVAGSAACGKSRHFRAACAPMTDEELKRLPRLETRKTLMPYSYYRLSERSGYGAGNHAPAYYELLWKGLCRQKMDYAAHHYLSSLAAYQREHGGMVSSAEIIEAVRLASALARLHGGAIPTLRDLRDGAVTCMGHGSLAEIALAVADTEIGTKIGSLPEGVSQTSIQSDFYRKLEELRLEKYKSVTAQNLELDLREKLTVKSQKAALMDLERSFFLHRLRVLGIRFASCQKASQDRATWAERWVLQWTPEAEIQIVEAVLKGDTIEQAAAFELKERTANSPGIAGIAGVIEDACCCGMPAALSCAVSSLQESAVDAASITEIAKTAGSLSVVLRYGDIRRLDRQPLVPILAQLFLRACLILPGECVCDDQAAKQMAQAMGQLHEVAVSHDFLEEERWLKVLSEIAGRDDLNTRLSGLAAAILLEMGKMDSEELGREVERRLSKGIPADLGAGWFEGLAMKNHYALIARLNLWEKLSDYLDTLDDEEFKRALVFLRRAFADFSSEEKNQIAENLGELWNVNPSQVSEVLNGPVSGDFNGTDGGEAMDFGLLDGLDDFDFGDI